MIFKSIFRKKDSSGKEKYTLFTDRDILRLVIPLFFEQLLFILVGSADTLMVAGLGEASISAVSLVNMFNNCISSIIFALSTGGAVVVSQFLGARNFTRANESAKQLIAIVLAAGLLGGLIWFIHPVMAGSRPPTKKELNLIRFIGGGLILIAFFTRSYNFL